MTDKKQILHITSTHSPYDGRIFHKELKTLSDYYDCYQIVANKYGNLTNTRKGKKTFCNNNSIKTFCITRYSNVIIIHYFVSLIRRIIPSLANLILINNIYSKILYIFKKEKLNPCIIHYHDLELAPVINKLKKKRMFKNIFDSHEFYFTYPIQEYVNIANMIKAFNIAKKYQKAINNTDHVITVTETMNEMVSFIKKNNKHSIIPNASFFSVNKSIRKIPKGKKITLIHEGYLMFNRGIDLMMEIFTDDFIKNNFRLKIIGDVKGEEKKYFKLKMQEYNLSEDNIIVTGWINYEKLHEYIDGEIGIMFFQKKLNAYLSMPNKLFNYIVRGLPIISTKCYESTKIIEKYGLGEIVNRDKDSIICGIKKILENYDYYQRNVLNNQNNYIWANVSKYTEPRN